MTEIEKLKDRLFGMGCKNFHVDVVEGSNATGEEIAQQVNRALDEIAAGNFETVVDFGDAKPANLREL